MSCFISHGSGLGTRRAARMRRWCAKNGSSRARGELGWSAESRKRRACERRLAAQPAPLPGATIFAKAFATPPPGSTPASVAIPEYTLAARHRNRRAEWFRAVFQEGSIPIEAFQFEALSDPMPDIMRRRHFVEDYLGDWRWFGAGLRAFVDRMLGFGLSNRPPKPAKNRSPRPPSVRLEETLSGSRRRRSA